VGNEVRISRKDWFMIVDSDDSVISIRIRRRDMQAKTALSRAKRILREHGIKVSLIENLGVREVPKMIFEPEKWGGKVRCWDIRFHESQE
jgi:ribosomal protein S6